MEEFDVVVVGAGPGGYPAAIRAAQLGARVAVVERESFGGTCLNWGCIPSKALIASAELFAKIQSAEEMGIRVEKVSFDYGAMVRRKDQLVERLHKGVKQLLEVNGVKIFQGTASFESRTRIAVTPRSGAPSVIGAAKTIIATGSTSVVPGFLPKHERVVESRALLDRKTAPASVLIMGGGIIGCEFACLLAHLGVRVTVVEMLEDILISLDADVRREVRKHMESSLKIKVLTGKPLEKVTADDRGVKGTCGGESLEAELLVVAVGRRAVTDGLKLENAGLKTTPRGTLEVDASGRTAAATIYAIGDVTDSPQLAHVATSQGIVAAENACGKRRKNETLIPSCIFTSPEAASVGLGEQEAAKLGRAVRTGKYSFASHGKSLAAGEAIGFVKWIVDGESDQLLGAQAVGAHATDLIAEAAVAIRSELTAGEIGRAVHAHPTLGEAWMEAAHAVHGEAIHAAPRKKAKA